jgi:hypothetical protein
LNEEKSRHASLAQQNSFWPSIFAQFAEAGKKAQQSLTPAVDWLDSLIGPGEFLLLVSHLFAVPVLDFMGGVGKSEKVNLDVRDIFAGLHTEHHWR